MTQPRQPTQPVVRVRVPAKLNLHLGVGAPRPDGYHELVTVFHSLDLCDEITVRPGDGLQVHASGAAAVPSGPDNLAWRAATLLAEDAGVAPNAVIEIDKAIPVAGGMAGGSADAAATLRGCVELWHLDVDQRRLAGLAAQLGSDVAFCLHGGTAVATGRGEQLSPVPAPARLSWVLASAPFGISSGAAYRELDRVRAAGDAPKPLGPPDALLAALADGDVPAIAAALGNDLHAAALSLQPSLAATLAAGSALGAAGALISGSGPTCAFLCTGPGAAEELAAALAGTGTCSGTFVASSPAYPQVVSA